jgi:hypothetical protein
MHDHLPKEGIRPRKPVPSYLTGVVNGERLVHQAVLRRFHQARQAVSNLVVGLRSQDLDGQRQRPNVSSARVRTAHAVDLPPRVEVLVLLRKDEPARAEVGRVLLAHEPEVGQTQQAGQVGVVVEPVVARAVDLVREDVRSRLSDYSVLVDTGPDSIGMSQHAGGQLAAP